MRPRAPPNRGFPKNFQRFALSTGATGAAGVAVIRVSGPQAEAVLDVLMNVGHGAAGSRAAARRHDAAAGDAEHAAAHGEARDARRGRPRPAPQLARVDVARRRLPVGRDVDQGAARRRRRVATEREFESSRTSDSHSHRAT